MSTSQTDKQQIQLVGSKSLTINKGQGCPKNIIQGGTYHDYQSQYGFN